MPNRLFWTQTNRAFSVGGEPVSNARVYFYENNSATQVAVYQDPGCTQEFSQPVLADGEGTFRPIYLGTFGPIRVRMTDDADVTLPGYPLDDVVPLSADQNQASSVQFTASEAVPETNVQEAIDRVAGDVGSQLALQQRSLTPWSTGGTGNTYTISPVPAIAAYGDWQYFLVRFTRGNTGPATLSVNGLGPRNIYRPTAAGGLAPVVEGDIPRGGYVEVYYNGSQFVLAQGGAIDGLVIGRETAAAITGTKITAKEAFLASGTVDGPTTPAFSWVEYPTTGFYATGAGGVALSLDGTNKVTVGQDFELATGSYLASAADTPNNPGYAWGGFSTTGLFLKSTNDGIGVSIAGVEKAVFDGNFTFKDGSIQVTPGGSAGTCNYTFAGKTGNGMHYFTGDESVNLVRASTPRLKILDTYTAFLPNGSAEIARVSDVALLIGVTNPVDPSTAGGFGVSLSAIGAAKIRRDNAVPLEVCRGSTGGVMLNWWRGTTNVAAISEDGSGTITYGTFCGSHWSQGPILPPGTIVETIDELTEWDRDEFPSILPKYRTARAGSRGVYGVFSHLDDDGDPFIAALGAYKIRIKAGVTIALHDLIVCGGDGKGILQADDVIRSSTVAKVTGTTVLETLPDGSFLVPCVLYCG